MDLPRSFTIRESSHRIHNPFTSAKLAVLGHALNPPPETRMLDLACGTGEMLCTWARDHRVTGTGVDISTVFIAARARAMELGVANQVSFVHGDASDHVTDQPVDIASCVGATWIGDGLPGTVELLRRSLRFRGTMLIGEPYWRCEPPDQATHSSLWPRRAWCGAREQRRWTPRPVAGPMRAVHAELARSPAGR